MGIKYVTLQTCLLFIFAFLFFFLKLLNYLFLLINDACHPNPCLFRLCFHYVLWEKCFFIGLIWLRTFGFEHIQLVLIFFKVINGKKSFSYIIQRWYGLFRFKIRNPLLLVTICHHHIIWLIKDNDIFGCFLRFFWSWWLFIGWVGGLTFTLTFFMMPVVNFVSRSFLFQLFFFRNLSQIVLNIRGITSTHTFTFSIR